MAKPTNRLGALLILVVGTATPASSHDIKVLASAHTLPEGGKTTIYLSWGHRVPVDELVDGGPIERYELIGPGGVTSLKKEGPSLQANAVELKDAGVHTAIATRRASIYTYVLGEEGDRQLKRGPKSDHAGAKIESATRYQQAGKAFLVVGQPTDDAPKPLGLFFEITPLDGPSKWIANSDIRFQILRDGKPVPTAEVVAREIGFKPDNAWSYATESNRKGEFTIRPSRAGTWVVKVTSRQLMQGAIREQYDFDSQTATLSLEVRP